MFDRITADPQILGGKPIVNGTRLSVEFLLEAFVAHRSIEALCLAYPELEDNDVRQVLFYAANLVREVRAPGTVRPK